VSFYENWHFHKLRIKITMSSHPSVLIYPCDNCWKNVYEILCYGILTVTLIGPPCNGTYEPIELNSLQVTEEFRYWQTCDYSRLAYRWFDRYRLSATRRNWHMET